MLKPEITPEIQEQFDTIQQKITEAAETAKTLWISYGIIAIALLLLYFFVQNPVFLFLIGAGGIGVFSYQKGLKKKVLFGFKENIIKKLIKGSENFSIEYQPSGLIDNLSFYKSKLFEKSIDRYNGEDLFVGVHKDTRFRFSELKVEEKHESTDSEGHTSTHYETFFQGVFFIADFHKNIKGMTRVKVGGDGFFEKLFSGKSKVNLENLDFEKLFNTYSTNQVEARYILTPDMMERLLKLNELFQTKISYSFAYNQVFIAIPSKRDAFELDSKKPVDDKQILRVFSEINSFLEIIDLLNLNTRIWGEVK
jgi:hypothetical protein